MKLKVNYNKMDTSKEHQNIKLEKRNDKHYLRADMGDNYYEGEIILTDFPKAIPNPISVVEKSLVNYSTPHTTIVHHFVKSEQEATFTVTFENKSEFSKIYEQINIYMIRIKKEQIDYINEQFAEMRLAIKNLQQEVAELKASKNSNVFPSLDDDEDSEDEIPVKPAPKVTPQTADPKRRARGTGSLQA
jgi:hypothetical protein